MSDAYKAVTDPSGRAILDALEDAGLVITFGAGRYKHHSIDSTPLRTIADRWPETERTPHD